ncbi:MAG: aminotransferase class I/II-fold pyridoxal phosphate-dependent enzyme [Deltaproteobacteria bacterium]|nr:aminotransferase class I/II-fold pyridoxal phosphate-dependent enzyme [Deltaproteobacteria bacterium]NIS77298.1 aminotransferase class I/II-fold pyridoxal phosphate-dependent enzyme [Deltaproteobacteria bacterium]
MSEKKWKFDTQVIHGAQAPGEWKSATLAPIYQTASHRFDTAEELSDVFAGKQKGFIYQRLRNPTNEVLEKRLAMLTGGMEAVVTGSGMAAINNAVLSICRSGDEIVSGNSLFMSTFLLYNNVLRKLGIDVKLVESADLSAWKAAVTPKTKLLFVETIGNPKMDVPNIRELADLAHENRAPLIVDNTLATPYLFLPLEHGADILVYSTTKYLNGHGSAVGGVVIDSGRFDWPDDKYTDFKLYKDIAGKRAFIDRVWREIHINFGTTQSPFQSYLTLIGLDTLALRMERHMKNTVEVARFLAQHPKVKWVNFPGLEDSPSHETAKAQFNGKGYGGLLTFGLEDEKACFDYIRNVRLAYHLANLGDCKTLVIHPWSSQYIRFTEESRRDNGITPDMVRVSVGIEAVEDILEDLDQALRAI